jgi:hypothetical protein
VIDQGTPDRTSRTGTARLLQGHFTPCLAQWRALIPDPSARDAVLDILTADVNC